MRTHPLAALITAFVLSSLPAQHIASDLDSQRRVSTLFISPADGPPQAGISIGYTHAEWRESYDAALTDLHAGYMRLGKNWWTTLDTIAPLEIGGTRVEAGSYFLGLAIGDDGAFRLLFFESGKAMKAGLLPWTTALYRGDAKADVAVPMTFAKDALKVPASHLEIAMTANAKDPANGSLSMRWGKHELSAPVKFLPAKEQGNAPAAK